MIKNFTNIDNTSQIEAIENSLWFQYRLEVEKAIIFLGNRILLAVFDRTELDKKILAVFNKKIAYLENLAH